MNHFKHESFHLQHTLTPTHISYFRQHGVIQFKNFIDRDTVRIYIEELDRIGNFLLRSGTRKINGIPLKFGKDFNNQDFIQRLAFASQHSQVLHNFLKDHRIGALTKLLVDYEGRVGENEKDGLVVNHYVNSPQSEFKQLGWHTDSPRDIFLGSRILPMLNVGLHLDDCPMTNGGLRVLPGTHTQGLFRLLFRKKYFIDSRPDKDEVGFDIEAGDLTVHDGRLWHRVQQSPVVGEASRRRVMYIPIITGNYKPKHTGSATPFYHQLASLKFDSLSGRLNTDRRKSA